MHENYSNQHMLE